MLAALRGHGHRLASCLCLLSVLPRRVTSTAPWRPILYGSEIAQRPRASRSLIWGLGMVIRAVAFDLDDTLAPSKSAISRTMADLLVQLADLLPVGVISGGSFEQYQRQVLAHLPPVHSLFGLHLMPTCGTRYYRHEHGDWVQVYAEDLSEEEKWAATSTLEQTAKELNLWEPDDVVYGPRIEDRGSQITYSALGQKAPHADKKKWDPDGDKRRRLQQRLQRDLPDLETRSGGSTSIDITRKGIDKAYGIREFAHRTAIEFEHILFVGDRLEPGGNDHPVVGLGVQTRAVRDCDETEHFLPELIRGIRNAGASDPDV